MPVTFLLLVSFQDRDRETDLSACKMLIFNLSLLLQYQKVEGCRHTNRMRQLRGDTSQRGSIHKEKKKKKYFTEGGKLRHHLVVVCVQELLGGAWTKGRHKLDPTAANLVP